MIMIFCHWLAKKIFLSAKTIFAWPGLFFPQKKNIFPTQWQELANCVVCKLPAEKL